MKRLSTGNEAVARGAYEAGCAIATGYPGTPSTEILENLAEYAGPDCEWSINEKCAMEEAFGASVAGSRAMVTMKHVGLNVAADPLFTIAYEGVNGGLVIVSADDPGMHSSQNEQDNRFYAMHAKIAMLEPSDSQECLDLTIAAFDLSERFDLPVLLRLTTRLCHCKSLVETGESRPILYREYAKNTAKYVPLPENARRLHLQLERKLTELAEYAEECPMNRIEWGGLGIGIITSGISYQYAKEVMGEQASYLKLGLTNPLPAGMIRQFASKVQKLYIIEENDPYLEMQVKSLGIACQGKEVFPGCDELSPERVAKALKPNDPTMFSMFQDTLSPRPPVLCPGCPHRGIFYVLGEYPDLIVTNDIGCYTLGMGLPASVTDTCVCMGGGFTVGIGIDKVRRLTGRKAKVIGIVGDSTFFHSGMTGLVDAIHHGSQMTMIILDNLSTAMTGHQNNPGTGKSISGEATRRVSIEAIVRAAGVDDNHLRLIDPLDLGQARSAILDACGCDDLFVIIARSPCIGVKDPIRKETFRVNPAKCRCCRLCLRLGCPAIQLTDNCVSIDETACKDCGLCRQVCQFDAIERTGG